MKLLLPTTVLLATSASAFVVQKAPLSSSIHSSSLYADVAAETPLAPLTVWGEPYSDIVAVQKEAKKTSLPKFALEITKDSKVTDELAYFKENKQIFLNAMQDHGAVIFRNFDITKTSEGFQEFYKALGLNTCLDPLHSVSARPTVDGTVYEAVNKESRKNFFIGMHNEFVGTRAPRAAAFGCFKAAEEGGEFLIADGRQIFRDIPADLLQDLYGKQIRYSVMELPFFNWISNLPEFLQEPISGVAKGVVSAAVNGKVDFSVDMQWGISDYDNAKMLQARAPRQPPIVPHPVTKDPTWFCNVHSHSSKLRQDREKIYGAERFEDGASRINKSDMFFGDDSEISDAQLEILDKVTQKNMKYVKMNQGDVVLLDNYKTMHGRNVFDGTRKHGVCWFEGWDGEQEQRENAKNGVIGQTLSSKSLA